MKWWKKVKVVNMKNTIVSKFIVILSLWLLAIMGVNIFIGYRANIVGFHIAAIVVAILLLSLNALHISLLVRKALHVQPKQAENVNR